jgi:hypothetical protein
MSWCYTTFSIVIFGSFGAYVFHHSASYAAGLAAGKVAVIALLQGNADIAGGFHLEAVHGLARIGIDEVIAPCCHQSTSPFLFFGNMIYPANIISSENVLIPTFSMQFFENEGRAKIACWYMLANG